MAEAEPTAEGLQAAREALHRRPELADGRDPEEVVAKLAAYYDAIGDSRFRLKYRLRPPDTPLEQADLDYHEGRITFDEYREAYRQDANRPADERMLAVLYAALDDQVAAYSHFIGEMAAFQVAKRPPQEGVVAKALETLHAKLPLSPEQLKTLDRFVAEARVDRRMGRVRELDFEAATAFQIVILVGDHLTKAWQSCLGIAARSAVDPRYMFAATAPDLFAQVHLPKLPNARALQARIHEEHAITRLFLRQRDPVPNQSSGGQQPVTEIVSPECQIRVHAQTCQVVFDAAAPSAPAGSSGAEVTAPAPLLSVRAWSDLALALDASHQVWGFTPPPATGDIVSLKHAVCLRLPGERWKALLVLAASSDDGRTVHQADLIREWGYQIAAPALPKDARARPGEIEQAQLQDNVLRRAGNPVRRRFTATLSDLRRELRNLVRCPGKTSRTLLVTGKQTIDIGFVVRCLVHDENERLCFGLPPRR